MVQVKAEPNIEDKSLEGSMSSSNEESTWENLATSIFQNILS